MQWKIFWSWFKIFIFQSRNIYFGEVWPDFLPKPPICLISLYIAFTNIKGNQANRWFRKKIRSNFTKIEISTLKNQNFGKSPKYFPLYFSVWSRFCGLEIPETYFRGDSSLVPLFLKICTISRRTSKSCSLVCWEFFGLSKIWNLDDKIWIEIQDKSKNQIFIGSWRHCRPTHRKLKALPSIIRTSRTDPEGIAVDYSVGVAELPHPELLVANHQSNCQKR